MSTVGDRNHLQTNTDANKNVINSSKNVQRGRDQEPGGVLHQLPQPRVPGEPRPSRQGRAEDCSKTTSYNYNFQTTTSQ